MPDIRSGAALVIAALSAEGTSVLDDVYHLDRGYEKMTAKLRALGAQVDRVVLASTGVAERDFSGVIGD